MRIMYGSERLGWGRHGIVYIATATMAVHSANVGRTFALKKTASFVEPHGMSHMIGLLFYYEDTRASPRLSYGVDHIKPRNFVFGIGENAGRLHLIDVGLSRPWINPRTGKPFPEESNCGFRGTKQFASRNVHLRHTPSRRDDMKSLAYTLVELLAGTLPWADTRSDDSDELLSIIYAHSGSTLCQGYDDCFARFIDYTRSLQYEDTPNYQYWRDAFRELVSGLFKAAMFDPDDASEPRVGMQKNFDRPPHTVDWPKPPQAEHTAGGSDQFLRAYSEGTPSRQMAEGTDSSRIWAPLGAVERPFRRAICSGTNSRSSRPTSSSSTHPQTMLVDCALIRGELPRRR